MKMRLDFPIWAVVAVALTPLAPLLGHIAVAIAETVVEKPHGVITNYFPGVARTGVLVMLGALVAGIAAGAVSLVRKERPRAVAGLAIATHALLIGLFVFGQLYKLGYDQDRGPSLPAGYIAIAEGLTADAEGAAMKAGRRLFSAPDLPALCSRANDVARLAAVDSVMLRVDEPFDLTSLRVVAFDSSGAVVPSVPVVIEVEPVTPPVLYFFASRLEQGPTANAAGFFEVMVRTLCEGARATVSINARAIRR